MKSKKKIKLARKEYTSEAPPAETVQPGEYPLLSPERVYCHYLQARELGAVLYLPTRPRPTGVLCVTPNPDEEPSPEEEPTPDHEVVAQSIIAAINYGA